MTPLQEAADAVMAFQWSNTREAMDALTRLVDAAYEHAKQQDDPVLESTVVAPNNDEVICPACSTQFRAIPVNVQQLMLDAGFEPPFTHPPQRKPLDDKQIRNRLWEADWPEVMLSDFVRAKLVALVRSVERAHGITEAP